MENDPSGRHVREDRILDLRFELVEALICKRETQFVSTGFREDRVKCGCLEILEFIRIEEERNPPVTGLRFPPECRLLDFRNEQLPDDVAVRLADAGEIDQNYFLPL